jgi:hypothetical protein
MNHHARPDRGVIPSIYRWLGRHPKTCLVFVVLLAMLHGAQLLVHFLRPDLHAEPFFTAAGQWLVLLALGSLAIAVGAKVLYRITEYIDLAAANLSAQNAHTQALIEARHPVWNAGTASSSVYPRPPRPRAVGSRDDDPFLDDPDERGEPTQDIGPFGRVS